MAFFDQLNNLLMFDGNVTIDDPLDLLGGSQVFDLGDQGPSFADFVNVSIVRNGDVKTIVGTFSIADTIDLGNGILVPFAANGSFTANGQVPPVPEPSSVALVAIAGMCLLRRRAR